MTAMSGDDFSAAISSIDVELPANKRLEAFAEIYSRATGASISTPLTDTEREAMWNWYRTSPGRFTDEFIRRPTVRRHVLYEDMKGKARVAVGLACPLCGPALRTFPIGIEPWSAQSRKQKVVIREAVTRGLKSMSGDLELLEGDLCLSVVSVVPKRSGRSRSKDVDNLVKGLLDSMSGYLYRDDSQITCLTTRRMEYAGTSGYYLVGVRPAATSSVDVIWDDPRPAQLLWGVIEQPDTPTPEDAIE